MNKPIYTIGDSHCWHAWCKIPGVTTVTKGPMTMYSFGWTKPYVMEGIPDNAIIVFCWGEIDCRCHVHKYQPWQDTIDNLVKNYIEAIKFNVQNRKDVWIYNVVPPPRKVGSIESAGFPFIGSDEERLMYVKYMNEQLRKSEFIFVDIFDRYCDAEGFLNHKLSDNHVHIEEERYLAEWINNQRI